MSNVFNLDAYRFEAEFNYKHGDLCQALRLALEDEAISNEIEETLGALLFHRTDNDTDNARELLANMLAALPTGAL